MTTNRENSKWNNGFFIRILIFFILGILSLAFVFFASSYTSPFYPGHHGADSAIFMVIGRAIAKGHVPYRDLFDIKGPLIFYLNAAGHQFYDGRFGVFIIQSLFMLMTVFSMYALCREFLSRWLALLPVILSLYSLLSVYERGNLTEEYSLPFVYISLWLILRSIKNQGDACARKGMVITGFFTGICFASLLLIRLNNGAATGAAIFFLAFWLISQKRTRELLQLILSFLAGFLLTLLPFFLYFRDEGCLSDFIYGTFSFLFTYAQRGITLRGRGQWDEVLINLLPLIFSLPLFIIYSLRRNKAIGLVSLFCAGLVGISLLFGLSYRHYFMMMIPMVTLSYIYTVEMACEFQAERLSPLAKLAPFLCFMLIFWRYAPASSKMAENLYYDKTKHLYLDAIQNFMTQGDLIPSDEKDSVWGFDIAPAWYYANKITPCFRFFINQSQHISVDPLIADEIRGMLFENPPKWLAVGDRETIEFQNFSFFIPKEYELVSDIGQIRLYKRLKHP